MKKEFVPYNEALELKQLEFDEPCFGYYNITWHIQNELHFPEYGAIVDKWNTESHLVSVPTYSQAFRWFREKYELFHSTNYQDDNSGPGGFDYEILNKRGKSQGDDEVPEFGTYEEAELACLQKLIEIVKTK